MTSFHPIVEDRLIRTRVNIVSGQDGDGAVFRRFPNDSAALWQWLYDYVSEPNEGVGRSGPVCPFVPPALKRGLVEFSMRYDVPFADPEYLTDVILAEMSEFDRLTLPLPGNGVQLHSRLISFPLLGAPDWRILDEVYENCLKDRAVSQGLMVGQFHPECTETAVRNLGFRVSRSPHAMVAMRRMAPHDILFLHKHQAWFDQFRDRFGERFDNQRVHDPLMRKLYAAALAEH